MDDIKKEIRKYALQNAFEHGGKTQDKIVLSKILGGKPEYRTKVKEIIGDISEIVSSINQISLEEQKKEIEENFPEILQPKEKIIEREGLPPLRKRNSRESCYSISPGTKWISSYWTRKGSDN